MKTLWATSPYLPVPARSPNSKYKLLSYISFTLPQRETTICYYRPFSTLTYHMLFVAGTHTHWTACSRMLFSSSLSNPSRSNGIFTILSSCCLKIWSLRPPTHYFWSLILRRRERLQQTEPLCVTKHHTPTVGLWIYTLPTQARFSVLN